MDTCASVDTHHNYPIESVASITIQVYPLVSTQSASSCSTHDRIVRLSKHVEDRRMAGPDVNLSTMSLRYDITYVR